MRFAECVDEIAGMFELQAAEKGLAFVFAPSGKLPHWVRADEKRVRQILINLIGNAIKFTAQGKVSVKVRYAREMAHVEIEDSGPGMSAAEMAQIFEPFSRATTAGQSAAGRPGAGLGLTIAKMLTDLMGGELSVRSAPGAGSVFSVRLFLPQVHGTPEVEPMLGHVTARRQALGYQGVRRKLLVVDNEETDRELLVQLLQPLGFQVRVAASGHDCLDLLATDYRPDAIFMDLAMPGIDGWETLRRIRCGLGNSGIHLAIVSANAFDKALENDVGIRPEDFIVKPVRHTELLAWLEKRLNLQWSYAPALAADDPPPAQVALPMVLPDAAQMAALLELVNLGFYRGILNKLAEIEQQQASAQAFVDAMRQLARQFQFEAMASQLQGLQREPVPSR